MTGEIRPTFRDPAGSLRLETLRAVRTIHPGSRDEVLAFVESDLCRRLQERGEMVAVAVEEDGDGLRLIHPRIPVATYPWEWTPSQWMAAAELTLRICAEAVEEGWILKDATPLNILFVGTRPVLVDAISFERRERGASLWLAYGQYVRTFLLPLIAHRMLGWPMAQTMFRRDGYEPTDLFPLLSWSQRLSRTALWPVSLPTWLERRSGADGGQSAAAAGRASTDDDAAVHTLKKTLGDLDRRTRRAMPDRSDSEWSGYPVTSVHYTPEQTERKRDWVRQVLGEVRPERLLDVGANTGEYSRLAAEMGIDVVAMERDTPAAERLFRMTEAAGLPVLTVQADLARPTPAVGWENSESGALLGRLEGQFDVVMLLAVIHHLLLLEQIPLRAIVKLCARLTRAFLVIEWVPATDPMFQSLMRGRDALYGGLCEDDLLAACERVFAVGKREVLGNGRVLLLLRKVEAGGGAC